MKNNPELKSAEEFPNGKVIVCQFSTSNVYSQVTT